MKKAFVFPGQGAQFTGMGKDMYDSNSLARELFEEANEILGFRITDIMFEGTSEDLVQTKVTQPALFLHSTIKISLMGPSFTPDMVAGHSLGEFSALVAAKCISFQDGLQLVYKRALAMQKSCEENPGTMAAIIGLADDAVELACSQVSSGIVVPANYNCPGQLVISGSLEAVNEAMLKCKELEGGKAIPLSVGGAFHSPLMSSAAALLAQAISDTRFNTPVCPIYQNVTAQPETDADRIKINLNNQLTAPVRWTQIMQNMISDGVSSFIEVGGNGKVLQGLVKKVNRQMETSAI
ncbi:MAG: ACP S-malonyltransferase [Bacteroidota bacterium]|jgi:[acyl-carrier-protein] S-malonyltransferase